MLNGEQPGQRRYQDQVPAVARAVRVLERLAGSCDPCTLADLARELGVGPSSLLAILTTLRHAGLVSRTLAGQYQVGPGLAALGSAAACRLRAPERFAAVADQLVATLGETVLLWVRQEDSFILAAAREGTQPLRYVPTPGLRLRADQTRLASLSSAPAVVEEEVLPGIWMMTAPLLTSPSECAHVAVAGPRERISRPATQAALLTLSQSSGDLAGLAVPHAEEIATNDDGHPPAASDPAPDLPSSAPGIGAWGASSATAASGPIDGAELDDFLGQSLVATLSYLADDGYPATVPLWYAWDGRAFWLASRPGSEWVEHVRLDPRVSLAVSESSPPLRRVLARGRLGEIDDPGGARQAEIEAQLAARYAGFDAAREPAAAGHGRLLELTPERLIAWRGLLRHPKLPPEPERPGSTAWRHLG
jgi:DNA-binding IclR family transcriptional regulator